MLKRLSVLLLVTGAILALASVGPAEEKGAKEVKVKGMIIIHPETGDVKVVTEDYQYHTIYFDKKTKVEATVKADASDLENEIKGGEMPVGTVTFVINNGKPVAKKISYKSGIDWAVKKKKKKD